MALSLLHNAFRPILVSRFDTHTERRHQATMLSLESQASSGATAVLAPLVGWAVDVASSGGPVRLWPVAAVGLAITLVAIALRTLGGRPSPHDQPPA